MKHAHHYYVYIVQCKDGLYYTGVTNDVDRRVAEHNEEKDFSCFTFRRRPVVLKWHEHFSNVQNSIAYEKQLKGWSRKKKEALFANDYATISQLAKPKKILMADPTKASFGWAQDDNLTDRLKNL